MHVTSHVTFRVYHTHQRGVHTEGREDCRCAGGSAEHGSKWDVLYYTPVPFHRGGLFCPPAGWSGTMPGLRLHNVFNGKVAVVHGMTPGRMKIP